MIMRVDTLPQPRQRTFLPEDFVVTDWDNLKPYYDDLIERPIRSAVELDQWIIDRSELDATVSEAFCRLYIDITVDSRDTTAADRYQRAVSELSPQISTFENRLNQKLTASPFLDKIDPDKYFIHIRGINNAVQLFTEENIPLATAIQMKSKEYVKIFSEMTIGVNGKQMTLQKASSLLEAKDRNYRESVYHKIHKRILQETHQLEDLFDDLLVKRHEMALNAGFENFRDYKFQALGRFDYTVEECEQFHDAIAGEVVPIVDDLNKRRIKSLDINTLRPWDLIVDASGSTPLKPFNDIDELIDKTIGCLSRIDPYFGECISIMREMGHLDLETREAKRPGGYNMPLHLTGVPFIFMNATESLSDMRTFMHESGHAIHSMLTREYPLKSAKRVPSEVAELAAMTMELLTMEHWDIFFEDEQVLKRAQISQLEHVLKVLPWIATIDKFQHWVYTHPTHNREERKAAWRAIFKEFSSTHVDHTDLDRYLEHLWHKQIHIFEVPFYYIEYGMAQLGAIAIWKRYRENPTEAIADYVAALKLGYTKTISEIYEAAGIQFNFSKDYVMELGAFIRQELEELLAQMD